MSFNVLGTKPSIWSPKWINGPGDFEKEKHETWITRRNFHNPLWVFLKRPKFWKLKTCSHLVSDLSWCEGFYCLMPQIVNIHTFAEDKSLCWLFAAAQKSTGADTQYTLHLLHFLSDAKNPASETYLGAKDIRYRNCLLFQSHPCKSLYSLKDTFVMKIKSFSNS